MKMFVCAVTKLKVLPNMSQYELDTVESFNSQARHKFWIVFPSASTRKECLECLESGDFCFLFNVKYDVHSDLEVMFDYMKYDGKIYPFKKVIRESGIKEIEWELSEESMSFSGNYYFR